MTNDELRHYWIETEEDEKPVVIEAHGFTVNESGELALMRYDRKCPIAFFTKDSWVYIREAP